MQISRRKILVTRGSGFIGTILVRHLTGHRADVLNFDRQPPMDREHAMFWRRGEVGDAGDIMKVVKDFGPNHIVTVPHDILGKAVKMAGMDLGELSLDTVKMFASDAKAAGFML